jgi:hypothetical protein
VSYLFACVFASERRDKKDFITITVTHKGKASQVAEV